MTAEHKPPADVVLQEFLETEALELFQLTDRNRDYLRQWLPWLDRTRSVEDTLQFIRTVRKRVLLYQELHFGIHVKGRLAGVIATHAVDRINRRTSIGYWLDEKLQGQGIVTQAVQQLLDLLFRDHAMHRVVIQCAIGNTRSQAIPERLGFVREGLLQENEWLYDHFVDHISYAILAPQWLNAEPERS